MKIGNLKTRNQKPETRKKGLFWSLFGFWFLVSGLPIQAAEIQISASLDKNQMALNEQAVLSITVSGPGGSMPQPQLPALPDFQVYDAGRSQNFTWINGKASASVTHNFVLTPTKEGQFTIAPIQVDTGQEKVESAPLSLAVVRGNPAAVQGSARLEGTPAAAASQGAPAVFITGTVDKTSVYVGEPVTYSFRLYNRVQLLSQPGYKPPEMTGFWTEDLPPQRNFTANVKGMPYNVTEVRSALFPSAPGRAHVGSATLTVNLENFGSDPFGSNFFMQFFGRGEEKVLRTEPVSITVKALPEPKPAGFKGAVGDYQIAAQVDKTKITVGQPLTLSLTISGKGNIKSLPDLPLPPLTNFRTFDATAATNIEKKDGRVQGSKVFKTVLIPTASGELGIPEIAFSYFDLSSKSYKTIRSQHLTIQVAPGEASAADLSNPARGAAAPDNQPGVKRLGEDIRYIHTPGNLATVAAPLYRQTWFRMLHLLLVGLFGALSLAKLYQRLFLSNTTLYRFRKAREQALLAAKKTDAFLSKDDIKGASGHLGNVLQDYLAAKLGVEKRTHSLKEVLDRLKSRGLSAHAAEKVRSIWETLDLFIFAPAQVRADELRSAQDRVTHVIDELEKEITWKN